MNSWWQWSRSGWSCTMRRRGRREGVVVRVVVVGVSVQVGGSGGGGHPRVGGDEVRGGGRNLSPPSISPSTESILAIPKRQQPSMYGREIIMFESIAFVIEVLHCASEGQGTYHLSVRIHVGKCTDWIDPALPAPMFLGEGAGAHTAGTGGAAEHGGKRHTQAQLPNNLKH